MKAEEVLNTSWIDTYNREIRAIWNQLIILNTNIYLLEKLDAFRFDLFQPDSTPFFPTVRIALSETSLMIIWRIAIDTNGESLTLRRLKNAVLENWRDDKTEEKKQFGVTLKESDFETVVSNLSSKVTEIRHNYLAHLNRERSTNPTSPENIASVSVQLPDLKNLLESITALFNCLCFDHSYLLWYLDYAPNVVHPEHFDFITDIDWLLDQIARNSFILNAPEQDYPDVWFLRRQHFSQSDIDVLNHYRRKFGLPDA